MVLTMAVSSYFVRRLPMCLWRGDTPKKTTSSIFIDHRLRQLCLCLGVLRSPIVTYQVQKLRPRPDIDVSTHGCDVTILESMLLARLLAYIY